MFQVKEHSLIPVIGLGSHHGFYKRDFIHNTYMFTHKYLMFTYVFENSPMRHGQFAFIKHVDSPAILTYFVEGSLAMFNFTRSS